MGGSLGDDGSALYDLSADVKIWPADGHHRPGPTWIIKFKIDLKRIPKRAVLFSGKQFNPARLCTIHILIHLFVGHKDNELYWYLLSVDDQTGDRLCRDHVGRPDVLPG